MTTTQAAQGPVPISADRRTSETSPAWPVRWLVARFYMSMLSIAGIDACFAGIYGVPLSRFLPVALVLVVCTLIGSHVIFRPVFRYLRDPEHTILPVRAIASLSYACTAFVAALVGVLAAVKFVALPALLDFDISAVLTPNERLWLPILHTLYYTGLIYFVMVDYEATLRERISVWFGKLVPALSGHFLTRLLVAFGVTTLLPISLIVLHVLERDIEVERRLLMEDLAATGLAFTVTLFFVSRSLLRPIHALSTATRAVERDDLAVTVPIMSNDETGRLAHGFNRMVEGLRERAVIRETFGRYVPERVASAILSGEGRLAPRSEIATILYADIEDFTSLAERASPDQIIAMLNGYFSAVVEPIESNDGVVTQFQGDALLVTFNLPINDPAHATSALNVALAIHRLCEEQTFAGARIKTRIGIATGRVTAGNVGSDSRLTYTVHGDAVNLAARLEQLNKRFGTYLLVDEETTSRLDGSVPLQFVEEVAIRGRERKLKVFTTLSGSAPGQPEPPMSED